MRVIIILAKTIHVGSVVAYVYLNIPIFAGGAGLCGGPPDMVLREGATPFFFAA